MKKRIGLILCAVALAVFSQEPSAGDRAQQRPQRKQTPEQSAAFKARRAEMRKQIEHEAGTEPQSKANDNQEKYDNIMGSFSDMAMQFSKEEESSLDLFVYECR